MSILRSTVMLVCVVVVTALSAVVATAFYFRPAGFWQQRQAEATPTPAAPTFNISLTPPVPATMNPSPAPLAPADTPGVAGDVVSVARKLRPAVVLVQVLDSKGEVRSTGTGFFISPDGKFVTNAHVVEGGKTFRIRRDNGATVEVGATLAYDRTVDLAVLQAKCAGVPYLVLERQQPVEPGEKVVVVGSPLGLEGTVSDGIVSATRTVEGDQLIQITAPLSPGSSGSPVVDLQGRLIGVATMASFGRAQSVNFAVAESHVRAMLARVATGRAVVAAAPALRQQKTGLSAKDIVVRLRGGFTSGEVAAEVKAKGTWGAFPPEQLARIREVGGRDDLLVLCKPPASYGSTPPEGAEVDDERALSRDRQVQNAQILWYHFRRETEANLALQLQRVRSVFAAKENARLAGPPKSYSDRERAEDEDQAALRTKVTQELDRLEKQIQQLFREVEETFSGGGGRLGSESLRSQRQEEINKLSQRIAQICSHPW